MPRNVPNVETTGANFKHLTLRMVDRTNNPKSAAFDIDPAATAEDIEDFVTSYASASNACIYEVHVADVWAAVKDSTLALTGSRDSVYDQVSVLFKKPNKQRQTLDILAPKDSFFVDDTDNVDIADSVYTTVRDDAETLMEAAYEPVSVRFSERGKTYTASPATSA